jgi:hypothetical protein
MVRAPLRGSMRTTLVVVCFLVLAGCQSLLLRLAGVPTSTGDDGRRGTDGAVCPPDCADGFECLELEPGAPICRRSCVVGEAATCPRDLVCRALADGDTNEGACVPVST